MIKKTGILIAAVFAVCLGSCGLEEYSYVSPVPPGNIIEVELNTKATMRLPSSTSSVFTNFSILYRIYVSAQNESGQIQTSSSALSAINSSLESDYREIYRSTDVTSTTAATNVDTLFRSRGYYEMALQGTEIRTLLDNGSRGKTIVIECSPIVGSIPTLTVEGGTPYNLYRSRGGDFIQSDSNRPLPDRYFQNHAELNAGPDNTAKTNLDVAGNSSIGAASKYAYISLYVVAVGKDTKTKIFSRPTFIGILRLPEKSS